MGEPGAMAKATVDLAVATGKYATFEATVVAGLSTVTDAVPAAAIFAAGTAAVNFEPETKAVGSGVRFQFTVAPETNPVPFTVRVNPGPPGTASGGTSG